ncbi:hypothetical protein G4H71_13620 [Rhodococcus triatomae]|uniref:Uncharacterized protein n=1 Tax=Rhodococcus triatomae TaxID=300028 RepID=A0A1G8PPF4_9NOCA|nr:hypothetical protein [Rhodococcus triatomae]QNG20159.1 hypothetical protein G4H72_16755 [Rhodococcus triatomae]QNG23925.1 hypothetical protein G4H71_13620 [Rhodococcus triatomae]SDI94272.1 hypothetical protein SAMN05444695_11396 [Rhodococcus triatomae]
MIRTITAIGAATILVLGGAGVAQGGDILREACTSSPDPYYGGTTNDTEDDDPYYGGTTNDTEDDDPDYSGTSNSSVKILVDDPCP